MNTHRSSRLAALLALPLLVALTGCGGITPMPSAGGGSETPTPQPTSDPVPTPVPTLVPTPTVTPEPTATAEEVAPIVPLATSVVVTSRTVVAFAADGTQLVSVGYDDADHASAAARLAAVLGVDPEVTTTGAIGTGCDADQTVYDFGGLLLRSPGYVASLGPIEVQVDAATTGQGIPITTVGGVRIGMPRADFDLAVTTVTDLGSYSGRNWVGFDRLDPASPEADAVGSLARFDGGVLAQWKAPRLFYGDC